MKTCTAILLFCVLFLYGQKPISNLSDLSSGIYILSINNSTTVFKIIKN